MKIKNNKKEKDNMARFYTEITKEDFLLKVQQLMEDDDFPYDCENRPIAKDLKKVSFDWENFTSFEGQESFASYPFGHRELKPGFHVYFVNAGGDWEFPICFIFYWGDGKLRAYIPEDGNVWNKKEKCAYGSELHPADIDYNDLELLVNEDKMVAEILQHIIKKQQ